MPRKLQPVHPATGALLAECEAPHGGVKQSGIGRTHAHLGLPEMVRVKYLEVDLVPKLWWFGDDPKASRLMQGFTGLLFGCGWARRARGGAAILANPRRRFV